MNAVATTRGHGPVRATLGTWLLPPAADLSDGLERAATASDASTPRATRQPTPRWSGLGDTLRPIVVGAILDQLRKAFPDELAVVLGRALATQQKLRDVARSTLRQPAATADVRVGHYQVQVGHPVRIEVEAPFVELTMDLRLDIEFTVVDAHAHLTRGCIDRLSLADPAIEGRVSAYDEVVFRQSGDLVVGGTIPFEPPLPVLSDEELRATTLRPPP